MGAWGEEFEQVLRTGRAGKTAMSQSTQGEEALWRETQACLGRTTSLHRAEGPVGWIAEHQA